jgi:[citrate (pro-3S)-lyase] ligase
MNFEDTDFRQEILDNENPFDLQIIKDFLVGLGFDYVPEEVDFTMIIYNLNDEVIGTGSLKRKTLKYVAVAPKFRESTAFSLIVTTLSSKVLEKFSRCFVYTRPETAKMFQSLGFSLIATAEPLFSVLEFGYESIKDYQNYLLANKADTKTDKVAAIVVNCNPFTKGHKYLIEKAAKENEHLYLFVVNENLSVFPFETRWNLIKEGIKHLDNVSMLNSGQYIVSGGIFPNYFLKNESWNDVSQKQAEVDVRIFADYIVPVLNITYRYIGTENYCLTTASYNTEMHRILPEAGVKVVEVERMALGDALNYISASKVRAAIKEDKLDQILDFLPEVTREFLVSDDSAILRERIKSSNTRH